MTFNQLRVFVAVAERQHLTRAAEALSVAQSGVSRSLATLEAEYGVRLFARIGRGLSLSPLGTMFLAEARDVLAQVELAEQVLLQCRRH